MPDLRLRPMTRADEDVALRADAELGSSGFRFLQAHDAARAVGGVRGPGVRVEARASTSRTVSSPPRSSWARSVRTSSGG